MIKSLRNKFVIVTTLLMVIVFGGFLIINTLYNSYWNNVEIIDMLDWIARSGIFTAQEDVYTNEALVKNMTNDDPIVGIILDQDLNIIKKQAINKGKDIYVPEKVIQTMVEKKSEAYKVDRYYYAYSELDHNRILLVVMDSARNDRFVFKIMGVTALSVLGIVLLILVTLFLSRFVTKPAEQSLLREKQFISDASHELKTPLGAISINAQAIQLTNEENIYINNILSETERMNRLVERLLMLSRLDEDPETKLTEINLSDLCEEMVLTYESVAFEKGVEYNYQIDSNVIIKGNEDDIRQLMAILIDNAIKNTDEAGVIHILCKKQKKQKLIEISNTGEGISKEDLPHVFERFYTSDKSRKNKSYGLGLAIAKAIVEKHKGVITVESKPEQETVFTVVL